MQPKTISIRPFIGAQDYPLSRQFYREMGFKEVVISSDMSVFEWGNTGFYLQDAYVKDWVDNTMLFLEVEDLDGFYANIVSLDLPSKYPGVRVKPIRSLDWGREFFIHDPSGILWHIGAFA